MAVTVTVEPVMTAEPDGESHRTDGRGFDTVEEWSIAMFG
jgi:hypothetical protein